MLPKKAKNNLNPYPIRSGLPRVRQILDESDLKSDFSPPNIALDDIDIAFDQYIKDTIPKLRGKNTPVKFLTNEKWGDFLRTFDIQDEDSNVLRPYCLIRRSETVKGTKNGGKFNVPQNRSFTYLEVPVADPEGVVIGADIYKIPQPVEIDLTYELIFSTNNMIELNTFDSYMFTEYASLQRYINVKGHYMPLTMQNNSLDRLDGLEDRHSYTKKFTILCKSYIQDADKAEIVRGIRKTNYGFDLR